MCLHYKQEALGSRVYCELIAEFGEEACPKDVRFECVNKMNTRSVLADPAGADWSPEEETAH